MEDASSIPRPLAERRGEDLKAANRARKRRQRQRAQERHRRRMEAEEPEWTPGDDVPALKETPKSRQERRRLDRLLERQVGGDFDPFEHQKNDYSDAALYEDYSEHIDAEAYREARRICADEETFLRCWREGGLEKVLRRRHEARDVEPAPAFSLDRFQKLEDVERWADAFAPDTMALVQCQAGLHRTVRELGFQNAWRLGRPPAEWAPLRYAGGKPLADGECHAWAADGLHLVCVCLSTGQVLSYVGR